MTCQKCGMEQPVGAWPWCPHGFPLGHGVAVIDDQIEGGPRFFEHMGHAPVWVDSKSQWKREMAARGLENVVRHDDHYYRRARRQHDECLRDTGQK